MIHTGKEQLRNENEIKKLRNTVSVFGFYIF